MLCVVARRSSSLCLPALSRQAPKSCHSHVPPCLCSSVFLCFHFCSGLVSEIFFHTFYFNLSSFICPSFIPFSSSLLLVLQADPGSSRQCCTYRIHPAILPSPKRSSLVFTPPPSTIALIKDWCFVACIQGLDYRLSSTVPSLVTQRSHRSATLRSTLLSALHPPSPSPPHTHITIPANNTSAMEIFSS